MSDFYTEMAATATELIDEFGANVQVISTTGSTYTVKGVVTSRQQAGVDLTGQSNGYAVTKNCIIDGRIAHVPEVMDKLVKDGVTHMITNVETIKPATKVLAYKLTLGA